MAEVALLVYENSLSRAHLPYGSQAVAAEVRKVLAERGVTVLSGVLDQAARRLEEDQLAEAREALKGAEVDLEAGRALIQKASIAEGSARLKKAEEAVLRAAALPEMPRVLATILLWRGVASYEMQEQRKKAEARLLFAESLALRVDPPVRLTTAEVRPEVAEVFAKAERDLQTAGRTSATVRITSQAGPLPTWMLSGLSLQLDGTSPAPTKTTTLTLSDLLPGRHRLLLSSGGAGYLPAALVFDPVRTQSSAENPLVLTLSPDPRAAEVTSLRRAPSAKGLRTLCKTTSVNDVIGMVAGMDLGQEVLVAQRQRCGEPAPAAPQSVQVGKDLPKAARTLVDALFREAPPTAGTVELLAHPALRTPRPSPPPPKKPTPFYAKPWVWLGGLAVGSGVILTAALWPRPEPTTLVELNPSQYSLVQIPLP